MNDELLKRVLEHQHFDELVRKKTRFGWALSMVMLAIYFGFILLVAFAPGILGSTISGGVMTLGIPLGVMVILSAFVLTGIYVRRANREFDVLNANIVKEVQS
ncbi:uncharacterized membrane protein (DUF485 family) [Chitinivorax tropicus]|uniref:Uncharacterized membrane protein (DUF485 family) n=1 Tax=Chitinivorax tropicus TaxID=714531 RepID=A0A840MRF4_9PROT|nr:DUF485 domain-containing protein [Chitinivorax tropicus]MBB5019687.1 uncharacterized membrane protein (DUF485 family) [Chitinivorax tropicus]